MRHVVTVQHPARGLARIECHVDHRHRWHVDGVAKRARDRPSVHPDDLEHMPVQMHRMTHHRRVVEREHDPLAAARGDRPVLAPRRPVDRPDIGLHRAAKHQHLAAVHRSIRQKVQRDEARLLRKVGVEGRRFRLSDSRDQQGRKRWPRDR
jgi:hypothetical protein